MPVVNFHLMHQAMVREVGGDFNQIVYWSRLPDWKNQTLTPNPDAIYLMPFHNTKDAGPVVLEIPPADEGSITGSIMDCWQAALEDGGPAGVDKGEGGKYLILPPAFDGDVPDGYIGLPALTFQGHSLLRSILKSGSENDVANAIDYGRRVRLYPVSEADDPPETVFLDAIDVVFDSTIPYDIRFFEALACMVEGEVWLTRDKVMIDLLKSLGIEKGTPFEPDAKTRTILEDAIAEARALLEIDYDAVFAVPFFDSSRWVLPADHAVIEGMQTQFADPDSYPICGRGLTYSFAFFSAKHLEAGQFYLMTIHDNDGRNFDGGSSYRLRVPPDAPITQYWSATVYDRATHTFIRGMDYSSCSSQNPDLQTNADGSVDIYFGPKAPEGKESNWVPTSKDGEFEVLFRLYGPENSFFERTWKLPDIEKVNWERTGRHREGAMSAQQSATAESVRVTVDNFIQAETDLYFGGRVKQSGIGTLYHFREPFPIDHQSVIRGNRDTLYSAGVFDLDAGPVTVTLPDAGDRFRSMFVINHDHYVPFVTYDAGSYTFSKRDVGTRYMMIGLRTLINPDDPDDLEAAHALQDAITVEQDNPGTFEAPNWDPESQKKVREALLVLASTVPVAKGMFGAKDEVDPIRHLIGTAYGWGGNPEKDATYLNVYPEKNDGKTVYRVTVKDDVPVDGFWSISVYNAEGYYEQNDQNAYSINNITAEKADDGTITVQFGGCDGSTPNCLPIVEGWNYVVRLYRPRPQILDGSWTFPEPVPVG